MRWQDELRFSIWRFFEQFFFVNNHLLCNWPTIHNSISKICPKFQVFQSVCRLRNTVTSSQIPFLFCRLTLAHGWMVKVSWSESRGSGSITSWCWILPPPLGRFAWHWLRHWARQCTDTRAFYIAALSIFSFSWISSVAISHWQGFNSEHEHPTSTILEHLWPSRARGPDLATCAGLAGELSKILEKRRPH